MASLCHFAFCNSLAASGTSTKPEPCFSWKKSPEPSPSTSKYRLKGDQVPGVGGVCWALGA